MQSYSSISTSIMQHYTRVSLQYLHVYSNQSDCFMPCQIDHDNQWFSPHGISFEDGSLIGEHNLFVEVLSWWTGPALWLGLTMRILSVSVTLVYWDMSQTLFSDHANWWGDWGRKSACAATMLPAVTELTEQLSSVLQFYIHKTVPSPRCGSYKLYCRQLIKIFNHN